MGDVRTFGEAEADLARATRELDGPDRLKALRSVHERHPEHDRTLVLFLRALRDHGGDGAALEGRSAFERWRALAGAHAEPRLPDDVLRFAAAARRPLGTLPQTAANKPSAVSGGDPTGAMIRPQSIDQFEILRPLAISESQHLYVASHRRDGVMEPVIARWLPVLDARAAEAWFLLHRDLVRPLLECRTTRVTAEGQVVAFYDCPVATPLPALDKDPNSAPKRRDRARIVAALAGALRRLHTVGVHHGDLRPDLVLVDRNDSGDWTVHLLPGWSVSEEGTRIAAPERESWFEGAPSEGVPADLYSLARIARELIGDRARAGSALGVFLRDLERLARVSELSAQAALGASDRPGLYQELVGADDWNEVERLTDWTYQKLLGVGTLGVVFEAQHQHRGTAAIKFLRTSAATAPVVAAFKSRALIDLLHDNLVHVEDVTPADVGAPHYEIMERLSGRSLADRLSPPGALAATEVFNWMRDLCRACTVLHVRGYAHLDLRPANVFLAVRGDGRQRAVLLDYRTGASLRGDTKVVARAADPRYTAPEIATRPPRVSAAADVFSAGRILDDLLARGSVPPHQADALRALAARMTAADAGSRPDFSVVYFKLDEIEAMKPPIIEEPKPMPRPPRPWAWMLGTLAGVLATSALAIALLRVRGARRTATEERAAEQRAHDVTKTQLASAVGERDAAVKARDAEKANSTDLKARLETAEKDLVAARANGDQVAHCTSLTVATYEPEVGAQCSGLGGSLASSMVELRRLKIDRLRHDAQSAPSAKGRHDAAVALRALDPADPLAVEALLDGRGPYCRDALDAAYVVIDGATPVPSLAESAWTARYECPSAIPHQRSTALYNLAQISSDTRWIIALLQQNPIDGEPAALARAKGDKDLLCNLVAGAIRGLPHESAAERKDSLRGIQLQRQCKVDAPITLTADPNATLEIFDVGVVAPRDVHKAGSFPLPSPATYEIQAKWTWPGNTTTSSEKIPLPIALQDAKAINLRRIVVSADKPLARMEIVENYRRSSNACEKAASCPLGVLFLGDVADVTITLTAADGECIVVPGQPCARTQNFEREVKASVDALVVNEVKVSVYSLPKLNVVTESADPSAAVTVGPTPCAPSPCELAVGTEYTIEAVPPELFKSWSGCPASAGARCTLTAKEGMTYTVVARFRPPGPGDDAGP